jgi:hypothetical protein
MAVNPLEEKENPDRTFRMIERWEFLSNSIVLPSQRNNRAALATVKT